MLPEELTPTGRNGEYPLFVSPVFKTLSDVPYLKAPGVSLLGRTSFAPGGLAPFLAGFSPDLGFADYLSDPVRLDDGTQLCKTAGQICYLSLGEKRSKNADARKYFDNIK